MVKDVCKRIGALFTGRFRLEINKRDFWVLLLLAIAATTVIFWRLGEGSLGDYDEADYAQSSREMLWLSDLNTPRWNGMEFFDKPPLCYWLTAAAYKVVGVNEFGARVASACAGVLAILLTYLLGRELFGRRAVGLGAAVMLLTVSHNLFSHGYNFVSLARMGMLDMWLILAMLLAVCLAWRSGRDPRALVWLGLPLGLGLMIKSVAGFMAFGIVGLYFLLGLPWSAWWRKELLWGCVVAAAVALPWHVGQLLIWGRQFWNSYMVSLTVGYVTGEQGHTKDWLFYFRSMQRGFPILFPVVAVAVIYGIYRAVRGKDKASVLLLCWTGVPMLLYNVSRSRIGWYMIPVYPALALLTARLLVDAARAGMRRFTKLNVAGGGPLAVALIVVVTLAFNPWLPRASDFNPGVKAVASYSRYVLDKDAVLVNYWPGSYWIRPSALFYADRPLLLVTSELALQRLLRTAGEFYVLADWADWEPLAEKGLGRVLYRSGGYVLVRAENQAATNEVSP